MKQLLIIIFFFSCKNPGNTIDKTVDNSKTEHWDFIVSCDSNEYKIRADYKNNRLMMVWENYKKGKTDTMFIDRNQIGIYPVNK